MARRHMLQHTINRVSETAMPVLEHTILMLPEFPAFANTMRESQQARGCDAKAGRPKVEAEVCHMWRGKKRRYVCHVGGIILSKNPP